MTHISMHKWKWPETLCSTCHWDSWDYLPGVHPPINWISPEPFSASTDLSPGGRHFGTLCRLISSWSICLLRNMVTSVSNKTVFPHPVGSRELNLTSTCFRSQHQKSYIEDLCDLDGCLASLMLTAWGACPQRSKAKPCFGRWTFFSLIGFE